jgi:hypothetical protein
MCDFSLFDHQVLDNAFEGVELVVLSGFDQKDLMGRCGVRND